MTEEQAVAEVMSCVEFLDERFDKDIVMEKMKAVVGVRGADLKEWSAAVMILAASLQGQLDMTTNEATHD